MGSVHASVVFHGRTAHSARPWQGENAVIKAAPLLAELGARAPRDVTVDGYLFREVITPTLASGGRSRNIVPDRFEVNLNYRFAPGRTPDEVLADLAQIVGDRAEVVPVDRSPAGRPHAGHPLVQKLIAAGVATVEVKQAWTDVARFDAIGVPAVNFGPGTQSQAHQKNEWTELGKLPEGYAILERFLTAG
jgi:succinyl-diaminopimelate desuccinylase